MVTVRTGRVLAVSGREAVVLLDGGQVTGVLLRHVAVAPGDIAVTLRDEGGVWVLGAAGEPAAPPPPPPPPPPRPPTTVNLTPTRTGSVRGGAWRTDTDQLFQGDWTGRGINSGVALLPSPGVSGATVTSCRVAIRRGSGGVFAATAPTLVLWSPALAVIGTTAGPALTVGQEASVALPTAWGVQLLSGAAAGVGIHVPAAAPYVALDGRSRWAASMTTTIVYQGG